MAMQPTQYLQFLRPYMLRSPLGSKKRAYLQFYHGIRHHGFGGRVVVERCLASTSRRASNKNTSSTSTNGDDGLLETRSHVVAARIEELSRANALVYPRIQNHPSATPMRIPTFREKYRDLSREHPGQDKVILHGRLQSVRRASSKLVFLDVAAEFEHVQGLCNFRNLEPTGVSLDRFKELSRLLKRGDLISITGKAVRTQAGELSVEATSLPQLLSPSLVPLPFKLEDEESKIQNRHIDMLVNQQTVDVLRLRSYIIKFMRDFFHQRDFLEFQTPILAENAGGAVARPFATTSAEFRSKELALRIAPELWLKRLVVGGIDKVFEIGPSFRNEGIDLTHNPEFTTCEFYNAYTSLRQLIHQTEDLVSGLAEHCQELISVKLTSLPSIDLGRYTRPYKQLEFIPALQEALGFTFPDLTSEDAYEELLSLLEAHDITLTSELSSTTLPKLLDKLAGTYLEPHSANSLLFITHHPACMSPLSKSFTCPQTGQLVSPRAELFAGGRELANMYEEENDPFAQRHKFLEQAKYKDATDGQVVLDESYVQTLESGLPPTGGWGCGIERLVMLFSGAKRISDCLSFGNLRNVVGLSAGTRKLKN